MKVIGVKNLQKLLNGKRYVTEGDMAKVFKDYGDDFFTDHGISSWERVEQKEALIERLKNEYTDIGNRL